MTLRATVLSVAWALALGLQLACSDDGADEGGAGSGGAGGNAGSSMSTAGIAGGASGTSGAASSPTAGVAGTTVGAAGNVSSAGSGGSHAGAGGGGSSASAGSGGSSSAGSGSTDTPDAGSAPAGEGPLDCDPKLLRCRIAELPCPEGQVRQLVDGCHGPCVPVDRCACDGPDDCPHEEQYTCHMFRARCGPYL